MKTKALMPSPSSLDMKDMEDAGIESMANLEWHDNEMRQTIKIQAMRWEPRSWVSFTLTRHQTLSVQQMSVISFVKK